MLKSQAIDTVESARAELKQYWSVIGDVNLTEKIKNPGEKENDIQRKLSRRSPLAYTVVQLVEAVMMNTFNFLELNSDKGAAYYKEHREGMGNHILDGLLGKK